MSIAQKKSSLFILSGPSGAGEDSIINGLEKVFSLERVITTTTREMRAGESQGNPYWFITREDFVARRDNGEFAEWAEQYNGNLYGVTKKEIERVQSISRKNGKIGIWKIEYQGVMTVKKIYPEIPAIFITVPDLETLENRIRRRDSVSEEYIQERMKYTQEWMRHADIYDYTIVNADGKLNEAIEKTVEIIRKCL